MLFGATKAAHHTHVYTHIQILLVEVAFGIGILMKKMLSEIDKLKTRIIMIGRSIAENKINLVPLVCLFQKFCK